MLLDGRKLKFMCLQAYCLVQLEHAHSLEGEGIVCCKNEDTTKTELERLADTIRKSGNTFESINVLAQRIPKLHKYYNSIGKVVAKHFEVGEGWIPAFLCLSILQEYTLRGHKGFEDFDFNSLVGEFEGKKENKVKKHFECAYDVVETISKMKGK